VNQVNQVNQVVVLHPATASASQAEPARPRYGFVRGPQQGIHALYDICDHAAGADQVIAALVRHDAAVHIVAALNAYEAAEQLRTRLLAPDSSDNPEEAPPPAAA
jgi:hypothetical protein